MTLKNVYKVHKLASLVEVVEGSEWVEYLTKKNILFFLSHRCYYYYLDKSRKEKGGATANLMLNNQTWP